MKLRKLKKRQERDNREAARAAAPVGAVDAGTPDAAPVADVSSEDAPTPTGGPVPAGAGAADRVEIVEAMLRAATLRGEIAEAREQATAEQAAALEAREQELAALAANAEARERDAAERAVAAESLERAAAERAAAVDALERSAAERASAIEALEAAAAARAEAIEARERAAAERDAIANQRDRAAVERDELANRRDRTALERDAIAGPRSLAERRGAAPDGGDPELELARLEAELQHAHLDGLTGAFRREMGRLALRNEIERARRADGRFVIAFVDVDGLKAVNDREGHAAGDRILRTLAATMRANLRTYDPIVRFGGDEFVTGISSIDPDEVQHRMAVIDQSLRNATGVGITAGLATLTANESLDELTAKADAALIEAKRSRAE